ncbi:MAG: hypothetical protein ABI353_11550 [Isosphaeraceae bacterium]
MSRTLMFLPITSAWLAMIALTGCDSTQTATLPEPVEAPRVRTVPRALPSPVPTRTADDAIPRDRQIKPRDTAETARDRRFADFLRDTAGDMIRQSTVGLEKNGRLRVQLSKSADPEDTLDLTKSILAGARKDFPDQAITEWVYDPDGGLILKAEYQPGQGVRYQLAGGEPESNQARSSGPEPRRSSPSVASSPSDAIGQGGVTALDRKFSAWAEEHGRSYLRYVESDLETHGRLWFGLTDAVDPGDVRTLTASLLKGAQAEFPKRTLTATVFDPHGERIGTARMGRDGKVQWEK